MDEVLKVASGSVSTGLGEGVEPVLVDPMTGEPTTTEPELGLIMVAGQPAQ